MILGAEASSSSLLPSFSPDAGAKLLGSESGISSGEPLGEGNGFSIHLQDEWLVQLTSSGAALLPPSPLQFLVHVSTLPGVSD